MRIVIIGCSHGRHSQLVIPDGDVLIHTGDYSYRGHGRDLLDFMAWFEAQSHKYKVFVSGNHDLYSEKFADEMNEVLRKYAPSLHYLCDSGITLEGINFWGSPVSPRFFDWAWNRDRGPIIRAHWEKIPTDTNVLITHGPAYGNLDLVPANYVGQGRDRHQGCHDLREVIDSKLVNLKVHAFSHLHLQGCQNETVNGVCYVNGAVVGEDYEIRGQIQVIELGA